MNKSAIRQFAIRARTRLLSDVKKRAEQLGITEAGASPSFPPFPGEEEGRKTGISAPFPLTEGVLRQRQRLVQTILQKAEESSYKTAYRLFLEETARAWFIRLIAIRFMEVNDYLPFRVLSSRSGRPELVTSPSDASLTLTEEDEEILRHLKKDNREDELFQMLFLRQCSRLSGLFPRLFAPPGDCSELLMNLSATDQEGVVWHLVHDIPEEAFDVKRGGQVELMGWLYQYYNTEPKHQVIDVFKGRPVSREDIPAATQVFTTEWVVRYIVDNSLGRCWLEQHPESGLKQFLRYYVQPEVTPGECCPGSPETLRVLDPCMGSGHFLVYAFEVLMHIYEERGYEPKDAVGCIMEKNLWGLDIDGQVAGLAAFVMTMKAMEYDREALYRAARWNLYAPEGDREGEKFGSLILVDSAPEQPLPSGASAAGQGFRRALAQRYDVVVTNPPYLNRMDRNLKDYVKARFRDGCADLFSAFVYRNLALCRENGYAGFMTPYVWMFIKSYEKLRRMVISQKEITTLIQMEYSALEDATVPVCAFVLKNGQGSGTGEYFRLTEFRGGMKVQEERYLEALAAPKCGYRFTARQADFARLPGAPIAYWASEPLYRAFETGTLLGELADSKQGIATADNRRFLRLWFECDVNQIHFHCSSHEESRRSELKWYPYNKGGAFRKWYGNNDYVVNWQHDGAELRSFRNSVIRNPDYCFRECASWSLVTSGAAAFRYKPGGHLFDVAGMSLFSQDLLCYLLGLCNTKVAMSLLRILAPTVNYQCGDIANLPVLVNRARVEEIEALVRENVSLARRDWDSFELSWDFQCHPLVEVRSKVGAPPETGGIRLEECYRIWERQCSERFERLRKNEEALNRIFIDIYGLQGELTPEVAEKDVTVRRADLQRDVKSLISYAVGCMFGRYSLDEPGLAFAGGKWDCSRYTAFRPVADNIIPITDRAYLEDDIVSRFCRWLEATYGEQSLEENLSFIAKALGGRGKTSREILRNYFLRDFFGEHCTACSVAGSGKRPIYWLFDSGKKNGFKALIYLHRYSPDDVENLRIGYLHRLQRIYEGEIHRMQEIIQQNKTPRETARARKRKEKLQKQLEECGAFDQKLADLAGSRIELDLDDGVKGNYLKLQTDITGGFREVLANTRAIAGKG